MFDNRIQTQLLNIFEALLGHFGPRHWWPAESPLEVVFGCILTQNVAWKNVELAISNLKTRNLIDIKNILSVNSIELAELIRATRYYNQKAAALKNTCAFILEDYDGSLSKLFKLETPELRNQLLALKGIGRETADSIILYAADKPIFVVDAYTKRIFSRLGFLPPDTDYDKVQQFFTINLPPELYVYNEYHALIDALGHNICKPKRPVCIECPLNSQCNKLLSGQTYTNLL